MAFAVPLVVGAAGAIFAKKGGGDGAFKNPGSYDTDPNNFYGGNKDFAGHEQERFKGMGADSYNANVAAGNSMDNGRWTEQQNAGINNLNVAEQFANTDLLARAKGQNLATNAIVAYQSDRNAKALASMDAGRKGPLGNRNALANAAVDQAINLNAQAIPAAIQEKDQAANAYLGAHMNVANTRNQFAGLSGQLANAQTQNRLTGQRQADDARLAYEQAGQHGHGVNAKLSEEASQRRHQEARDVAMTPGWGEKLANTAVQVGTGAVGTSDERAKTNVQSQGPKLHSPGNLKTAVQPQGGGDKAALQGAAGGMGNSGLAKLGEMPNLGPSVGEGTGDVMEFAPKLHSPGHLKTAVQPQGMMFGVPKGPVNVQPQQRTLDGELLQQQFEGDLNPATASMATGPTDNQQPAAGQFQGYGHDEEDAVIARLMGQPSPEQQSSQYSQHGQVVWRDGQPVVVPQAVSPQERAMEAEMVRWGAWRKQQDEQEAEQAREAKKREMFPDPMDRPDYQASAEDRAAAEEKLAEDEEYGVGIYAKPGDRRAALAGRPNAPGRDVGASDNDKAAFKAAGQGLANSGLGKAVDTGPAYRGDLSMDEFAPPQLRRLTSDQNAKTGAKLHSPGNLKTKVEKQGMPRSGAYKQFDDMTAELKRNPNREVRIGLDDLLAMAEDIKSQYKAPDSKPTSGLVAQGRAMGNNIARELGNNGSGSKPAAKRKPQAGKAAGTSPPVGMASGASLGLSDSAPAGAARGVSIGLGDSHPTGMARGMEQGLSGYYNPLTRMPVMTVGQPAASEEPVTADPYRQASIPAITPSAMPPFLTSDNTAKVKAVFQQGVKAGKAAAADPVGTAEINTQRVARGVTNLASGAAHALKRPEHKPAAANMSETYTAHEPTKTMGAQDPGIMINAGENARAIASMPEGPEKEEAKAWFEHTIGTGGMRSVNGQVFRSRVNWQGPDGPSFDGID